MTSPESMDPDGVGADAKPKSDAKQKSEEKPQPMLDERPGESTP